MDYSLAQDSISSKTLKVMSSMQSLTLIKMLGDSEKCLHLMFTPHVYTMITPALLFIKSEPKLLPVQ